MHIRCSLLILLIAVAAMPCWSGPLASLQQVKPGIYVALQPFENRFNDSNATVIIGDNSVLVVDTQTTLTTTRKVIGEIREITGEPVLWVVNTHWHGDHVQGNQAYREIFPNVKFLAQEHTREDMAERTNKELQDDLATLPEKIKQYRQMLETGKTPKGESLNEDDKRTLKMRIDVLSSELPDLRKTHIVLPDLTFGDTLSLYQGQREIRLMHYGGHTRGDAVVYLPAEKVLITGDLVDDMPYTGDGSLTELLKTLKELDRLDFDVIIPGHGGIEYGHEHLRLVSRLFESIQAQVQKAIQNGATLEDVKKEVDVEEFRKPLTNNEEHATRAFDGFVPAAIERAYAEEKAPVR